MQEDNAGAEVGPSGNPTDGLPPDLPVCDNYISLCMDMYLHQIVACNITKVFV